MIVIVGKAAYQGSLVAWLWVMAYVPAICLVVLTLIEQFGLAPLPWLPYNAIVVAVAFEIMVLLLALHLHVKSAHTQHVRDITMGELDPLTGFIATTQYPDALAQLWGQARSRQQDIAVAYVRATVDPDAYQAANHPKEDDMVVRCVRMLRMVTRQDDTVARIGKNVFAILMPGVSPGPNLANKLSRLIALGGMRDTDDAAHIPLRFRIAATSFHSYSGTSGQLDAVLWRKLSDMASTPDRTIEFVKN
jgi:two-component system, sensor histidine kinase LadS